MLKINYFILIFFILSHCSIYTKTGLWKNKNYINDEKNLSEINFNKELSFKEFRNNIILYGKKSKYPIITK